MPAGQCGHAGSWVNKILSEKRLNINVIIFTFRETLQSLSPAQRNTLETFKSKQNWKKTDNTNYIKLFIICAELLSDFLPSFLSQYISETDEGIRSARREERLNLFSLDPDTPVSTKYLPKIMHLFLMHSTLFYIITTVVLSYFFF